MPEPAKPASASNRLYDIPSLENDGNNFQVWKFRILMVLDVRGLLPLVNGTEIKPVVDPKAKAEDIAAMTEKIADWDRRDKEARAQITLTLKDEPLSGVIHAVSASDVWDKLLRRYEGKGKQTVAFLTGEIFRGTFTDDSPLEPQLNAVRHKAYILKTLKHELSDALIAISLIISLPESYSTLRTILMATPEDQLTSDFVITQVLTEERSRNNPNSSQVALLARNAKGKGNTPFKPQGKKDDSKKSSLICNHCKRKGHIKSECRKLKAELASKDSKGGGGSAAHSTSGKTDGDLSAKVASVGQGDDDIRIRLFIANGIRKQISLRIKWVVDSGCTSHMSSNRRWFHTFRELDTPKNVWLGDESFILATGIGQIFVDLHLPGGKMVTTCLTDVYYVPELHGNLLSVMRLNKSKYYVQFTPDVRCEIYDQSRELCGIAKPVENLYVLDSSPITREHAYICTAPSNLGSADSDLDPSSEPQLSAFMAKEKTSKASLSTWHRRLGHAMLDSVRKLFKKKMVKGMEITVDDTKGTTCIPCLKGKQHRNPISKSSDVSNPRVLHRAYSDLVGPMQTTGRNGERYFMPFMDAKSHLVKLKNLRAKSEAFAKTKGIIARAEVETGLKLNFYHTDIGGEFTSAEFKKFLEERGDPPRVHKSGHSTGKRRL